MVFNNLLNPVFSPLLSLPPFWGIVIISFLVTLLITIIYKLVTDQELMKTLKADMKAFQAEMKKLKDNPKKMMEIQKKAMEKNMQYMMASMKPTLFTLLPILIIFGWLGSHLAFHPINPADEFELTATFKDNTVGDVSITVPAQIQLLSEPTQTILNGKALWVMKGEPGDYFVQVTYDGREYNKQVIISENTGNYAEVITVVKDSNLKQLMLSNEKVKPMNLFGWQVGWLGTYIIFSIIFSTLLRKLLKLH